MMVLTTIEDREIVAAVREAVQKHGAQSSELIPVLLEVNERLSYLPTRALVEISREMGIPVSRVYSVASFYTMLSIQPRGRHIIQFCESAPCHVMGGRQLWEALVEETGLQAGETSPDGRWTLLQSSCLGVCGVGPLLMVDDQVFGNMTPRDLPAILAQFE